MRLKKNKKIYKNTKKTKKIIRNKSGTIKNTSGITGITNQNKQKLIIKTNGKVFKSGLIIQTQGGLLWKLMLLKDSTS